MPPTFPVSITGKSAGCDPVTLTASGGESYLWDGGDTPNQATNTFHESGTYIVTVNRADGCISYLAESVTVAPRLSPTVSIATSGSQTICAGALVTFTATPVNGGASPQYQWIRGTTPVGSNSPTYASSSLSDGDVINCVMTSDAVCAVPVNATSNSIMVKTTPSVLPAVSISPSANNICSGTQVTFTAIPVNGGNLPVYQWQVNAVNSGDNSATFTSTQLADGDIVTCTMSSNANCVVPATITSNSVMMLVNPAPVVNGGGNKTIDAGNSTILDATAIGDIATISWSPATGLDNPETLMPAASPMVTTNYTLTVTGKDGCVSQDAVTVTVLTELNIPNTITPNGDGINDTWTIGNIIDYQNVIVNIYDRYGQTVFHSEGYSKPWDGTLNGKPLPNGTYYYVIILNNKITKSGWVAVIR